MKTDEYLEFIRRKLEKHFVITQDESIGNQKLDLFASSNLVLGRTLISRKDIIDRYESNEYVLIKSYDNPCENEVADFLQMVSKLPEALVKPHKEHRNSYINAVLIGGSVSDKGIELVKKFKCNRIYKMYLHGYCETRVILVDLSNSTVSTNKAGNQYKKVYKPTP